MVEPFHSEELAVDSVVRLVQHRAHRRHLRVFQHRILARFLVLEPAADPLTMLLSHRRIDSIGKVEQVGLRLEYDTVAEFIQTRFWNAKAANRDVLVLA
jgi:hypothetical protein